MELILKEFINSLLDHAIPTGARIEKKNGYSSFAFIPTNGKTLNESDIMRIAANVGLSPIFPVIYRESSADVARKYARMLSAPVFYPRSNSEIISLLSDCAFAVSESAPIGILSIIAGAKVFLPSAHRDCAELLQNLRTLGVTDAVIAPYSRRELPYLSPLERHYAEFTDAKKKLRTAICAKLLELS